MAGAGRYGLVRVRENAESIAFYGGEGSERRLLAARLASVVANYGALIVTSRNLQFFTSFYRCMEKKVVIMIVRTRKKLRFIIIIIMTIMTLI